MNTFNILFRQLALNQKNVVYCERKEEITINNRQQK